MVGPESVMKRAYSCQLSIALLPTTADPTGNLLHILLVILMRLCVHAPRYLYSQ